MADLFFSCGNIKPGAAASIGVKTEVNLLFFNGKTAGNATSEKFHKLFLHSAEQLN
jgi:hypothetical protein